MLALDHILRPLYVAIAGIIILGAAIAPVELLVDGQSSQNEQGLFEAKAVRASVPSPHISFASESSDARHFLFLEKVKDKSDVFRPLASSYELYSYPFHSSRNSLSDLWPYLYVDNEFNVFRVSIDRETTVEIPREQFQKITNAKIKGREGTFSVYKLPSRNRELVKSTSPADLDGDMIRVSVDGETYLASRLEYHPGMSAIDHPPIGKVESAFTDFLFILWPVLLVAGVVLGFPLYFRSRVLSFSIWASFGLAVASFAVAAYTKIEAVALLVFLLVLFVNAVLLIIGSIHLRRARSTALRWFSYTVLALVLVTLLMTAWTIFQLATWENPGPMI